MLQDNRPELTYRDQGPLRDMQMTITCAESSISSGRREAVLVEWFSMQAAMLYAKLWLTRGLLHELWLSLF